MISKRKLAANRANAKKSTGPTSAAGKEKVSQNAVKHALCGRFTVLSCENQEDYNDLLHRFMQIEQPADDVERELVAKMARYTWCSKRAQRLQDACLNVLPDTGDDIEKGLTSIGVRNADLLVHMRYQSHHDRAYQRASNELAKRRKQRGLAARGLASQKQAESQQELREAEEKRRERRHEQREERHKTAVALDNKHLDLAHTKLIQASHDVAELFTGLSPAEIARFAA